jgi:hypothetical protein
MPVQVPSQVDEFAFPLANLFPNQFGIHLGAASKNRCFNGTSGRTKIQNMAPIIPAVAAARIAARQP